MAMQNERVLRNLLLKLFTLRRERDRLRLWHGPAPSPEMVSWGNGGGTGLALIQQVGGFADELERRILNLNLEAEVPSLMSVLEQVETLLDALHALETDTGSVGLEQTLALRLRFVSAHLMEIRRDLEVLNPSSDRMES